MLVKVPFLREEQIERDAGALLVEFAQTRATRIVPPVPIEDIIEKHLKLGVEFDNMHRLLGVPRSGNAESDILGAIFFDERRIVIDECLDPEVNRSKEGRYRFTLAHEGGGHWRLHRHLFAKDPAQISLLGEAASPSVVCRSSQTKETIEWQADFYASCLLMPRKLILAAWDEMFPDRKPRIVQPPISISDRFVEVPRIERHIGGIKYSETNDEVLDRIARPLAEEFQVSTIAMRIRLEKLGLLRRVMPGLPLSEKLDWLANMPI
jgi:Zn-dependent peptidase ImmA (M78 family)